ncbi:MAG: galactose oxidase-like domain-containing protein [Myxococcaceae bacterium]
MDSQHFGRGRGWTGVIVPIAILVAAPALAHQPDFTFVEPQGVGVVLEGGPVRLRWEGSDLYGKFGIGLFASRKAVSTYVPPDPATDMPITQTDLSLAEGVPYYDWDTTGLSPGCYQAYAVLRKEGEVYYSPAPGKVTVRTPEAVPPSVWITNLPDEEVDEHGRFIIRFKVNDPDSATTVSLKYGNGTTLFDLADGISFPPGGGEGTWEFDASALENGYYELYARVDSAGEPSCEALWVEALWVPGGPYAPITEEEPPTCEGPVDPVPPPEVPSVPIPEVPVAPPVGCGCAGGGALAPVLPLLFFRRRRRPGKHPPRGLGRAGFIGALMLMLLLFATNASAQATEPAVAGQWSPVFDWPDTGTHLILLPTGKVLSWTETAPDRINQWDPATDQFSIAAWPGYNVFCGGHAFLADGKLLVSGGHFESNVGLPHASIYDPFTNTWTRLPDMNAGRWYPTTTTLPNGDMLVIAGTATAQRVGENRLPQVWEPANGTWRDLTGAQLTLLTYPWMFVAPDGKLFAAGSDEVSRYLDTSGVGAWTEVAESLHGERYAGTAVMYDDGKVMVCGGGSDFPTETVEVIDLNSPTATWRAVSPMAQPRKQHNATLLPDGTVLVTGGSQGAGKSDPKSPVFGTELWDPATEKFTQLAPSGGIFRGYHSSAILLPDGRVLSTGGEDAENAELFSPPYLFKGARPKITSTPREFALGQQFEIMTPDAANIAQVTLLRLGATTHAFNQSQRFHRLSFTQIPGGLRVTAPANGNIAQPGYFMLFILNRAGVPSVSSMVHLQDGDPEPTMMKAIAFGEAWKYDDRNIDHESEWLNPAFDDAWWKTGPMGTPLAIQEGQSSVYLRKKVILNGLGAGASLQVKYADGVAVWINGTQVFTANVGNGTTHTAFASASAAPGSVGTVEVPPGVLVDGENLIAAIVKDAAGSEAGLSFDLDLSVTTAQAKQFPLLSIQRPNGGETLVSESTAELTWRTFGAVTQVDLAYSLDDGGSWEPIAKALANSDSYTWTLPSLESEQVLVKVSATAGGQPSDMSDGSFKLSLTPEPECSESRPCGEGFVCAGTPATCQAVPEAIPDAGVIDETPGESPSLTPRPPVVGCGCTATNVMPVLFPVLLALRWATRSRRGRERNPGGGRR